MSERPIIMQAESVRAILAGRKTQTRRTLTQRIPDGHQPVSLWRRPSKSGFPTNDSGGGVVFDVPPRRVPDGTLLGGGIESRVDPIRVLCPYGMPGARLWVREKWALMHPWKDFETGHVDDFDDWTGPIPKSKPRGYDVTFAEGWPDDGYTSEERGFAWRSPLFMPRWASRLTLEITHVRVQRLHEVTEADAIAEGMTKSRSGSYWDGATHPIKGTPKAMVSACAAYASLWDEINGKRKGCAWESNPWVWSIAFRRTP